MSKFDHEAYLAELRSLSTEALCRRLEGKYETAVGTYNPGPLQIEAAKRIHGLHKLAYERWEIANSRIRELEARLGSAEVGMIKGLAP